MNKKKTILQRIWNGIKLGYNDPMLPKHVHEFNINIYVIIFKWIGNISVILIMGGFKKNSRFFYIIIFLSFIYIIYRIVLGFYIIKHLIFKIKSGELIIQNSSI
jgi:hypothetical protein